MQEKKQKDGLSAAKECSWAKQKNKKKLKKTNNGYIQLANHPRNIYLGWFFYFYIEIPDIIYIITKLNYMHMINNKKAWSVRKMKDKGDNIKNFPLQMNYGAYTCHINKEKRVILLTHLGESYPSREEREKIITAVKQQLGWVLHMYGTFPLSRGGFLYKLNYIL